MGRWSEWRGGRPRADGRARRRFRREIRLLASHPSSHRSSSRCDRSTASQCPELPAPSIRRRSARASQRRIVSLPSAGMGFTSAASRFKSAGSAAMMFREDTVVRVVTLDAVEGKSVLLREVVEDPAWAAAVDASPLKEHFLTAMCVSRARGCRRVATRRDASHRPPDAFSRDRVAMRFSRALSAVPFRRVRRILRPPTPSHPPPPTRASRQAFRRVRGRARGAKPLLPRRGRDRAPARGGERPRGRPDRNPRRLLPSIVPRRPRRDARAARGRVVVAHVRGLPRPPLRRDRGVEDARANRVALRRDGPARVFPLRCVPCKHFSPIARFQHLIASSFN